MSIAFESGEVQLLKLRERLRLMSDEELVKFGKMVGGLGEPRVGVTPDPRKAQLEEARAQWRRRHPKAEDQAQM
jgi:hypothetical protein